MLVYQLVWRNIYVNFENSSFINWFSDIWALILRLLLGYQLDLRCRRVNLEMSIGSSLSFNIYQR